LEGILENTVEIAQIVGNLWGYINWIEMLKFVPNIKEVMKVPV
jgi:hypothetical protein